MLVVRFAEILVVRFAEMLVVRSCGPEFENKPSPIGLKFEISLAG